MQLSVAAAAATLGNLKLGDSKAHAWSFDNFIDGVNSHRKDLSWRAIAERLDVPGFFVMDAEAFSLLVRPTSLLRSSKFFRTGHAKCDGRGASKIRASCPERAYQMCRPDWVTRFILHSQSWRAVPHIPYRCYSLNHRTFAAVQLNLYTIVLASSSRQEHSSGRCQNRFLWPLWLAAPSGKMWLGSCPSSDTQWLRHLRISPSRTQRGRRPHCKASQSAPPPSHHDYDAQLVEPKGLLGPEVVHTVPFPKYTVGVERAWIKHSTGS